MTERIWRPDAGAAVLRVLCASAWMVWLRLSGLRPATTRRIPNPLAQHWPHELVSMDFPSSEAGRFSSVRLGTEDRPLQWEPLGDRARVWFVATVQGEAYTDSKGRRKRNAAPKDMEVSFGTTKPPSPLQLESGDGLHIHTGAELRLHDYQPG